LGGGTGAALDPAPPGVAPHAHWFGEDQARYVLAVPDAAVLLDAARASGVPAFHLGRGNEVGLLILEGERSISIESLRAAHEATLPALMGEA
ncbi:MAG: phosphoribosylformylglycinamidine synthase II, partial [Acetobacteraceae bacterium]|nr:phosphoribosylformylglycinamidine synthase II [Acetobacteraceae bacterium]